MNRDMKKLSRVELLELMVELSEDYDELSAENARLKKMLASHRLPKNAKVGSIAEAALQANGYFYAAQRSADEYLREIKHLRDELALRTQEMQERSTAAGQDRRYARIKAQAEAEAQAIIRDAQARANQMVAAAQAQAQAALMDAQRRTAAMAQSPAPAASRLQPQPLSDSRPREYRGAHSAPIRQEPARHRSIPADGADSRPRLGRHGAAGQGAFS